MMLEHVKLHKIQGVSGSVLCALLIFPSIVGFFLIARKSALMRLRNIPQVRLFGSVPLGNSIIWGYVLIAMGAMACCAYFFGSENKSEDLMMFLFLCLPILLTGILLTVYWARYRSYEELAEQTLRRIAADPCVDLSEPVATQGITWNSQQQKQLLEDLRDNDIILFEEAGGDHRYRARIILPDLQFYCNEVRKSIPFETWNCRACGAPNNSPAGVPCEYCGALPEAAAKGEK